MKSQDIQSNINTLKKKILPIIKNYRVTKAGIFGSTVRGENKKNSDVDLLIEFDKKAKIGLFDIINLKFELEEKVGKSVDLVEYGRIKERLKPYILPEEVRIYEKR